MKTAIQKISSVSLGLLLLLVISVGPVPAHAFLPTVESNPLTLLHQLTTSIATNATQLFTGQTAVTSQALATKEFALDPLAWTVEKIAMQSITRSTVNWINSGFKGSPAFVTNLESSLLQVGDTYANQFLNQLATNAAIDSPFRNAIAQAVRSEYLISSAQDGFFLQNPFTLGRVSPNPAAFQAGNFSQGGWNAWFGSFGSLANNPFGAQLLARNAVQNTVRNAVTNQQQQWQWSGGFNGFRGTDCPTTQNGITVSSGGGIVGSADTSVNLTGGTTDTNSGITITSGSGVTNTGIDTSGNITSGTGNTAGVVVLSGTDPCLLQPIRTPGQTIANSLNKALGASQDTLVTSDEIDEVIGALMSQLTNQVLGAGGLLGTSQPQAGGGRSYIDQAADPSQITASQSAASGTGLSAQFLTTIQNQESQLQQYQSNWQKINTAATTAKTTLANDTTCTNSASIIASSIQPVIDQSAAGMANAAAAIAQLDTIKNNLISASASTDTAGQAAAVSTASAAYQTFLGAKTTPSVTAITYAADQSQDSSVGQTQAIDPSTGSLEPQTSSTLYSEMVAAGTSCSTGVSNFNLQDFSNFQNFNFNGFTGLGPNL